MDQFSYELMFNSIPEGIFAVDTDLTITLFNETAARLTGWQPQEVIGKKCYFVLKSSECGTCPMKKAMNQAANCHLSHQVLILTKDEKPLPVSISTMPLKDKDGAVIGAVEIIYDQRRFYPTFFGKFHELGLVGSSAKMQEVFQLIEVVAETESNILILGKTGTGKELVANAIHKLGRRRNKPFIKVNCSVLSDNILESELFGHERGAFTGAVNKRIGRFEKADGGTIFLDEIAEISTRFQAKLLRVIQEGEFERVGSSQTLKTDVRIIVATNKDLSGLVKQNLFRDDLFYRLNVFPIYLPDLKERKSDLKALTDYMISQFNASFQKQIMTISEEALGILRSYNFPGNVRELRNIIEHAFIKCRGNTIGKQHLPDYFQELDKEAGALAGITHSREKDYICQVIEQCLGNKSQAAKILGISRKTLYNKLRE